MLIFNLIQDGTQTDTIFDFDPYVAPRPCTFSTCKNHVPGNSTYKRCDYHRKQGRESHEKQIAKRELQKTVWKKAVDEGRDPEEALKALLKEQGEDSDDESDDDVQVEGGEKLKFKNKKGSSISCSYGTSYNNFCSATCDIATDNPAFRRNRENVHLCSSKECQNLLQPDVRWLYFTFNCFSSACVAVLCDAGYLESMYNLSYDGSDK